MSLCIFTGLEHRLEYCGSKDNIEWWTCMDCGESENQFHDLGSGA